MVDKYNTAICFVANFKYLYKHFPRIYQQLRTKGNYSGEIVELGRVSKLLSFINFIPSLVSIVSFTTLSSTK